jgi:hypothetical protein
VTKNRRLSRWLALLLASDCGRRLQAIIMVSFGGTIRSATSDDIQTILAVLEGNCLRERARRFPPPWTRSVTSPMIALPSPPNQRVSLTLGDG